MKKMIWGGMAIGSTIGGCIPYFWTLNPLSFSGLFLGALGGVIGIYCGWWLAKYMGAD